MISLPAWMASPEPSYQARRDGSRAGGRMRQLANSSRIEQFMRELGRAVNVAGHVYLTGGATAILHGWRDTTIDVDKAVEELFSEA